MALLRPERKGDVGAVLQVDVERVGAAFGQVVSRHVEDPPSGRRSGCRWRRIR